MRYRLQAKANIGSSLAKVFQSFCEEAALNLLHAGRDADKGIHNARKQFKEARSLLRLLRPHLPADEYRTLQQLFRQAGRQLAAQRDAQVMIRTWRQLQQKFPDLQQPEFTVIEDKLLQNAHDSGGRTLRPAQLHRLAQQFEANRQRGKLWSLQGGFELLEPSLRRFYRRSRAAWMDANRREEPQAFHESRKRFKDLYYAVRLLRSACGKSIQPLVDQLAELTETLGESNDLAVLEAHLVSHRAQLDISEEDWPRLQAPLAVAREQLLAAAHQLAKATLEPKPALFIAGLRKHWEHAKKRS